MIRIMFGGEDDDDFTPNPSSKLASLFGFGKTSSEEGNASLTYTAPKQPKKSRTESQNSKASEVTPPSTSSSAPKLSIILVKAVSTYKLAEGNYNAQGKLGAAVLGNAQTKMYQLLLYKGKQQHVTSCRITAQFHLVRRVQGMDTRGRDDSDDDTPLVPEKAISHASALQWTEGLMDYLEQQDAPLANKLIGLARANSVKNESEKQLLTQDLLFGVGSGANEGDMVEIRYVVNPTNDGKQLDEIENTMQAEKPVRVKLSKGGWEEGILGASKGCKRMIMLPPGFESPWKGIVSTHCGVVVEVEVGRFKSMRPADSGDSTDDTSIKARGESISEALTNSPKTHKASIISRMARMGQATLPLKGAVPCNPSDSEETEEETSVVNKAPAKTRVPKNRPSVEKPVQNTMLPPPQHVALYQPRANGSMTYMQPPYPMQTVSSPQMYPVNTPPAMPSPESHMSILLAEGRTQNAELRMGVAKIADKVDQVLMKVRKVANVTLFYYLFIFITHVVQKSKKGAINWSEIPIIVNTLSPSHFCTIQVQKPRLFRYSSSHYF
ncbi:hypothetical protein C0J52_03922 [Blattella germanica]|nr:hypothetical protein C0J52_03922 [Blattella germanica]